jgi:hypothetical protein
MSRSRPSFSILSASVVQLREGEAFTCRGGEGVVTGECAMGGGWGSEGGSGSRGKEYDEAIGDSKRERE